MSTLTLRLPDGLKDRLTVTARRFGKSPARFVRETLENRLKATQSPATGGSTLYELSRDLCGSAHGGPRDLAANKKHLAGYGSWKR
ncbi:MAG: ribbon-helix-helix domain-containing protein [Verrucomicrobia bacterium]|nr:ribbon-helix-helix domain-containing protein [Verrucomicrobiota bacterium]